MRLLALDTTGPLLSAALAEGAGLRAFATEPLERGQAERVLPLIRDVLARAGRVWADLDLIAVAHGPGGFTAVRTGVAVARALALARGCGVVAVGTLEAEALAAVALAGPGPLLVAKDLRRGQLALQAFDGAAEPQGGVRLVGLEEGRAAMAAAPRLAGDGLGALAAGAGLGAALGTPLIVASGDARYVAAAAWKRVSGGERALSGSELRPFYPRPPDAAPAAGRSLLARAAPA